VPVAMVHSAERQWSPTARQVINPTTLSLKVGSGATRVGRVYESGNNGHPD